MTTKAALQPNTLLAPFRAWDLFCTRTEATSKKHREKNEAAYAFSPAKVWLSYYKVHGLFLSSHVADPVFDSRRHQLSEFKRVELMCGRALFESAHFPQANEATPSVDNFIDHVTKNWCLLMSPRWDQIILGPANRIGLCQDVLKVCLPSSSPIKVSSTVTHGACGRSSSRLPATHSTPAVLCDSSSSFIYRLASST